MKYKILIFIVILILVGTIYQIQSKNNKKYEKYIVVIDPGHGGRDQGASRKNVYEEDINFEVCLYLKQLLEVNDITVIMTRTSDVDLASSGSKNRKREDLKNRVSIMNTGNVFVSIHMNISSDSRVSGSQVFYGKEDSLDLANCIQGQLQQLNASKFSATSGDYYILRNTNVEGVIVECGFLSNENDREKLQESKYQEDLAYAICKGILEYKNGVK